MTKDQYDMMIQQLGQQLRSAPGFVAHVSGPAENGWSVTEVWQSEQDFNRWMDTTIKPGMAAQGMAEPRITPFEVYNRITPG